MAEIVVGIGTSHSPILAIDKADWGRRGEAEKNFPAFHLTDGRVLNYEQLLAERGPIHADKCTDENFSRQSDLAQAALDRLAEALREAKPDVLVIIGDDQSELFSHANMPAVSIFYGQNVVMHKLELPPSAEWARDLAKGYGMTGETVYRGHPEFARELIERLIDEDIDIGAAGEQPEGSPAGFGHAYGFVMERIAPSLDIPIVPVLLNTYYPPNTPRPSRCYDIGKALGRAIKASKHDLRVAVIGSGGLSHFICEEELDHKVMKALVEGDREALTQLPVQALMAGSSEIRNWITAVGALDGMTLVEQTYIPVYRTPAGTGIGLAFASWVKP